MSTYDIMHTHISHFHYVYFMTYSHTLNIIPYLHTNYHITMFIHYILFHKCTMSFQSQIYLWHFHSLWNISLIKLNNYIKYSHPMWNSHSYTIYSHNMNIILFHTLFLSYNYYNQYHKYPKVSYCLNSHSIGSVS